jgi:hypothetical protein
MNFRFSVVETNLNRAEFRWKWLRFVQHSAALGSLVCLSLLFFGGAMLAGWVTSKAAATTFFALVGGIAFIAWTVVIISIMAGAPDRAWLAATLERIDRRLLDRLNTLLFLEQRRLDLHTESFARRIARQTAALVADKPVAKPFSSARALSCFLTFLLSLALTAFFYQRYTPWMHLLAAQRGPPATAVPEKPLELAPPSTNTLEQNLAWGEVRITDPGTDLKVTKVDVVPLQIEAAANQALQTVNWYSMINGGNASPHELPPPAEPRYAVYQPTVYLDELRLADWDVMTYYAQALTEKQNSFASEVYFLEVRPFREDILKMPGGEGGQAYQTLSELSSLINRQQHVIRQTHQHIQKPPEPENLQAQDRRKLADAEGDLRDSTQHLYAKMAAQMENKPIGDALDNLAKAEKSLGMASGLLVQDVMDEAQNRERGALSELVAARKMFQKAVSDNPNAFDGETPDQPEPTPVVDSAKKLSEMAEFRNEAKAAQDFVKKTLDEQKKLEQQARAGSFNDFPQLGRQEQRLQEGLQEFRGQHPQHFKGSEEQAKQAQLAMSSAADSLEKRDRNARTATRQASQALEKLNEAMQSQSTEQQLADAYRLKDLLDQQIKTLDQRSRDDSNISDAATQKTARDAQDIVEQLTKSAEQEPTRNSFGQPLRDALSGDNKVDLKAKLLRLERPRRLEDAQDGASAQQRAADARDALAKVSKAFEASQPRSLQMAHKSDALKPGDQDSFAQGMAELDSLIKQCELGRSVSPEDQAKQGQEALLNLQTGMRAQHGDDTRGNDLLLKLQDLLKGEKPVDIDNLKKLLAELQHFSVETSTQLAKAETNPEVSNIDPSRLPPAYRGRIQKYFQKLSER